MEIGEEKERHGTFTVASLIEALKAFRQDAQVYTVVAGHPDRDGTDRLSLSYFHEDENSPLWIESMEI